MYAGVEDACAVKKCRWAKKTPKKAIPNTRYRATAQFLPLMEYVSIIFAPYRLQEAWQSERAADVGGAYIGVLVPNEVVMVTVRHTQRNTIQSRLSASSFDTKSVNFARLVASEQVAIMGCGICCMKFLLILFNTLFGIIGLVLVAGGAFVLASSNEYTKTYLDKVLAAIPGLPEGFNLEDAQKLEVGGVTVDVAAILKPVAIFLIVFGLFLIICAIFGSCGSCCNNRFMLAVYAALVLILLLIQVVVVALFFSGALDGTIKSQMKATIRDNYISVDDAGLWSLAWSAIMIKYECCGVENYKDFNDAKKWKRVRTVTVNGASVNVTLITPLPCCKLQGESPDLEPIEQYCAYQPNDLINNWKNGCYEPLNDDLEPFYDTMVGAIAGVLVFEFLCAVAAIAIAVYIQKGKNAVA
ncbi:hypothetical protein LSH36_1386g00015 [Paralvinella palmiformis]|uniref:Tetraspanin n=1 Tax=Paralvinella palmiformis TaxID=53620 RepID=A0AAD9IT06_9ANNE|nr:hypothetical protein LSH36_1386g00015 [Paralvinella palmiformis]